MKIKELIEDLQNDLYTYGNVEVRAETPTNQAVVSTIYARCADTGRYTLFLMLEDAE